MRPLAENIWLLSYPLKVVGFDLRRNVSVIRLQTGRLIIHSSGPFSAADVRSIQSVGEPSWLVDVMLRHDTFAQDGRTAFPSVPYLAPVGFQEHVSFPVQALLPPPAEWSNEVTLLELAGAPGARETVFLHSPSRTLFVADLVMNFPGDAPFWSELFLNLAIGSHHSPGVPRSWKLNVKDDEAFRSSLKTVLSWDFDRIVVGHGVPIETGGKERLTRALNDAKLLTE